MHRLALLLVVALLVGACSPPPTITAVPATAPAADAPADGATPSGPTSVPLMLSVNNHHVSLGLERVSFDLAEAGGAPVPTTLKVTIAIYRLSDIAAGQTLSQRTASGEAVYFGAEMPDGGSWVVYHDFDSSGPWSLEATATWPDGRTASGRANFQVEPPGKTPYVGSLVPALDNPVLTTPGELAALSADTAPDPELYRMKLADAVVSGRPTVVTFGSPAVCETCGATLSSVKVVRGLLGSQANFIHVPAADPADPTKPSAAAASWDVGTELPWTFVIDGRGTVTSRVEGPLASNELELLVKRALEGA